MYDYKFNWGWINSFGDFDRVFDILILFTYICCYKHVKIMEAGTLFEVLRWGFSIFIVVWCFSMLYTGIKDMNDIDDVMKDRKSNS